MEDITEQKVILDAWQRVSLRGFLLSVSGLLGFPDVSRWFSLNGETSLPDHEKLLFLGQFKRQPAQRGVVPLPHPSASRVLTWVWSCPVPSHTRPAPQANILWHLTLQGWLSRRVFFGHWRLRGCLCGLPGSMASQSLWMGLLPPTPCLQKVPLEPQSNRPAEWAHLCSVVHLQIGILWLLTWYFSTVLWLSRTIRTVGNLEYLHPLLCLSLKHQKH